jgi:predicted nucleic acid-binding protein
VAFVLDASIVGCWCFQDEDDARATAAWRLLESSSDDALVPAHWWFEVRNVVLQGERRGRVTAESGGKFIAGLERFVIDHAPLPDGFAVLMLARKYRLTFYDAVYLELAQRAGLALATLDQQLANAARAEDVTLVAE